MDKQEKIEFITRIMDDLKETMISRVYNMPEDWDGVELRWYIIDKSKNVDFSSYKKTSKRYKDYANTMLVRNL